MPFDPDILVASRDGTRIALVVEVKLAIRDLAATERQLKLYMVRNRCSTGMLVTPETVRIYRDTFTSYDEGSVERVGEFPAAGILDADAASSLRSIPEPQRRMLQMEDAVQAWLEGLTGESAVAALPDRLREAVEEHVVPALEQGEVRAAGPRSRWGNTGT
jgi:hypothetical protein